MGISNREPPSPNASVSSTQGDLAGICCLPMPQLHRRRSLACLNQATHVKQLSENTASDWRWSGTDARLQCRTLSSLFCQLSSLFTMSSIQCDRVAKIPAVVALNVIASPLKSIPFIPLELRTGNTGKGAKRIDTSPASEGTSHSQWLQQPFNVLFLCVTQHISQTQI